jgi:hypothetical protein
VSDGLRIKDVRLTSEYFQDLSELNDCLTSYGRRRGEVRELCRENLHASRCFQPADYAPHTGSNWATTDPDRLIIIGDFASTLG